MNKNSTTNTDDDETHIAKLEAYDKLKTPFGHSSFQYIRCFWNLPGKIVGDTILGVG